MTERTLVQIEHQLAQPFPPEEVKFLPKSPRKNSKGEWVCLALPYADKRSYEDRLNALAFGYWSTPYNAPYAVGNKLVIPVTVSIFGLEHTDFGEAFLTRLSRKGEMREEENSATEAYPQGFRRACAQFRLGRYFYTLPKMWVSYDPVTGSIALTDTQKYQLTVRMYAKAGLLAEVSLDGRQAQPSSVVPVDPVTESTAVVPKEVSVGQLRRYLLPLLRSHFPSWIFPTRSVLLRKILQR